jgi:predicted N-formylglutamate amidohydrolase
MISDPSTSLLAAHDPPAVRVINPDGRSSFLLIGDHAGNAIPAALGTLGLGPADLSRHIAWDIGIGALGALLAAELDAVFVRQSYSRLVIDCNRDPASAEAVPDVSDGTVIPGNAGSGDAERAARIDAIHAPYQAAIGAEIARRESEGRETRIVSLHSFTPSMGGVGRPWQIGILHDTGRTDLAQAMLGHLRQRGDLIVGDNQPYVMDATDHTVPRHALPNGLDYAEIEIRQDLLVSAEQQENWSRILAATLRAVTG